MVEEDQSFATDAAVPSFVGCEGGTATEDAFARLFVQQLEKEVNNVRSGSVKVENNTLDCMLHGVIRMGLHLPENTAARESISGTRIIGCLVNVMRLVLVSHKVSGRRCGCSKRFSMAVKLMQHLVSGGHTKNIAVCYHCGALPLLMEGMQGNLGSQCNIVNKCSTVIKLLRTEEGEECLLDFSYISTIVSAMKDRQDLHEWGCSQLKFIIQRWDKCAPSKVAKPLYPKGATVATNTSASGPKAPAPAPHGGSSFSFGSTAPAPAFSFNGATASARAPPPAQTSGFSFGGGSPGFGAPNVAFGAASGPRNGGGVSFGDGAPAPASAPAPAPTSGITFGCPAPPPAQTSGFAFGSSTPASTPRSEPISDDVCRAFLQTGAVDAILQALRDNSVSPGIVRDASTCLQILACGGGDIRSALIEKGAVALLGASMQRWPGEAAQQAILGILGAPSAG